MLRGVVALVTALCACPVLAEIPDSGLLNDVTSRFLTQSTTWGGVITRYASWMFWVLATISMVWTFGMMALRKADIGEFFAEFLRFTVTTGFFWWLLANGPAMAMAIINSLRTIGAEAGGLPNALTPSTPITIGFDIVKKAFSGLSWTHPIDNLGIVLVSAAIVVAMAIVAANILIALVTAWMMAYAGVFILGFGGARWTSDMAIGYFKAMLGIGLELMTMTLMVAIAVSVIDGFYRDLDGSSVYELLLVLCVCVVLALLIDKIPARVAALGGGGSGAGVGVGTVMGGAAVAAAAMASAGAVFAAGAVGAAGGAQALMAAFSKANASESGGGSSGVSALMDAAGGAGAGAADAGGASNSVLATAMGDTGSGMSGSSGFSSAAISDGPLTNATDGEPSAKRSVGNDSGPSGGAKQVSGAAAATAIAAKASKVAVGTVVNIAQGARDIAKAKAVGMKDSAMERISVSAGGKIAAAIHARDAATNVDSEAPQFNENSLSAGSSKLADAESEIAAFRDRKSTHS